MLSIAKTLPPQKFLAECFDYNPTTGVVVWKVRPPAHFCSVDVCRSFNRRNAGKVCGTPNSKGYLKVKLGGQKYFLHRIIWKLVTGNDPVAQIDHKNGVTSANCWDNLREATRDQNQQNRQKHPNNKWGYKGVEWRARDQRFRARLCIQGKKRAFGAFKTAYEAHLAYIKAVNAHYGEFAAQKVPSPPVA